MTSLTFTFPDGGAQVQADIAVAAGAPRDEVDALATLVGAMAVNPGLARLLLGAVEGGGLRPAVESRLLSAIDAAAGPAVSPLEVL